MEVKKENRKAFVTDFDCTLTYIHTFDFIYNIGTYYLYHYQDNEHIERIIKKYNNIGINNDYTLSNYIRNILGVAKKEMPPGLEMINESTKIDIVVDLIFGGSTRLEYLKNFLDILKKNNFDIYISTFSECEVVHSIIKIVDLDKYIEKIHSPRSNKDNIKCKKLKNKTSFIISIINLYDEIYYVDDDNREVNDMMMEIKEYGSNVIFTYFGENVGLMKNMHGLSSETISRILEEMKIGNYNVSISGGYMKKYIKYKKKYLMLKKIFNK